MKGFTYPINFFLFIFFVYFVFKYFAYLFLNIPPLDNLSLADLHLTGFYLLAFFSMSLIAFHILNFFKKIKFINIKIIPRFSFGKASYYLIFLNIVLLVILGGTQILLQPLQVRRIMTSQGMYYFTIIIQFITSYYSLELLYKKKYKSLIIFAGVFFIYSFVSGRAALQINFFLNLLLFLGIYYHRSVKKYVIVAAPIFILYVIITGFYRDLTAQSTVELSEVSDAFSSETAQSNAILNLISTKFLYRMDILESFALLSNALERNELSYVYGQGLLDFSTQFIPRIFWDEKPLTFTNEMTKTFRPDVYYNDAANNFTGIGELLYNFGPIAIFFGGLIYGILLFLTCQLWEHSYLSFPYSIISILLIYPYMWPSVLAGFVNDQALPTLIVTFLLMLFSLRIKLVKPLVYST